ncbi:MAG: hypothetical protein ACE5GL_10510 [Calditrichia bacterium]
MDDELQSIRQLPHFNFILSRKPLVSLTLEHYITGLKKQTEIAAIFPF